MTAVYLPIFPLPDQTFFPRTFLPLHIFEARYRAMITGIRDSMMMCRVAPPKIIWRMRLCV